MNENNIDDSILLDIKHMIGLLPDDKTFDNILIIHINSAFDNLLQLGVGPLEGYVINSENNKWSEFIDNDKKLEFVKTYIYLKIKILFDSPLSSSLMESYKQTINELEWRLNVAVETESLQ